ncbi:hypothetical protein ACWJJH_09055 [Endozoicomonadaceae bacterium StTr2]
MKYSRFLVILFFAGACLFYSYITIADDIKFTISSGGKLAGCIQKTIEPVIVDDGLSPEQSHFGWTTLADVRGNEAAACSKIKPKYPDGTVVTSDGKKVIILHSYYFYINRHVSSIGDVYRSDFLQRRAGWSILVIDALSEGLSSLPVFVRIYSKHIPIEEDPSEQDLLLTHESRLPEHLGDFVYLIDPVVDISLDASYPQYPYDMLTNEITIRCLNWLHEDRCMKAFRIPQCSIYSDSNQATNKITFISHDGKFRSTLHLTILFPSTSEETKKTLSPKELKARQPEKIWAHFDTKGEKVHVVYEKVTEKLNIDLIRQAVLEASALNVL